MPPAPPTGGVLDLTSFFAAVDMADMVFMDANQFVSRAGPYWATKAIDPKGREVSLSGRFRMREVRGPLLVKEVFPYEFEVFLPAKSNEQ
jgi:hypothetical protein